MATKTVYLSGDIKWAKLTKPDTMYVPEGVFSLCLFLDEESKKIYKESGLRLQIKEDEGREFIRLRRLNKKMIKGDIVEQGRPHVLDQEGNDYHGNNVPIIGNGSQVTCKVSVYDTMKGKGHTLEAVRIDELVEYETAAPAHGAPF